MQFAPSRLLHRQPGILLVSASLALILGAACGGGDTPEPTASPAPAAAASPSPVASPARPPLASPSPATSPAARPTTAAAAPPTASTSKPGGETYTVVAGDTLIVIAEKVYEDGSLWRQIYEANEAEIGPDPDALQVGMQLTIPPRG